MRQARFFTINAASDVLERDRRTIAKALRDVPPDMKDEQGRERWKLSTIVHALSLLDRAGVVATTHDERSILDELKRLGDALQRGLERLQAEPNVEKRRVMLREIGPSVGALDRAFRRDIESRPEGEQPMLKIYCDTVVGRIIGELMALCELELDDEAAA